MLKEKTTQGRNCSESVIIITHKSCMDGLVASWLLSQVFHEAEVIACFPGKPPQIAAKGKSIICCDIAFAPEVMDAWWKEARELVVLDHHVSNLNPLGNRPYMTHSNTSRCGAGLVWEWLGKHLPASPVLNLTASTMTAFAAWLVGYIEDHDLHRFSREKSRQIVRALFMEIRRDKLMEGVRDIERLLREFAADPGAFMERMLHVGEVLHLQSQRDVEFYCSKARKYTIEVDGQKVEVPVVIMPVGAWMNDTLTTLQENGYPFAVSWWITWEGDESGRVLMAHVSIRCADGDTLGLKFAQSLGGGGHQRACAARVPIGQWLHKLLGSDGLNSVAWPWEAESVMRFDGREPDTTWVKPHLPVTLATISQVAARAHETAKEKGWHDLRAATLALFAAGEPDAVTKVRNGYEAAQFGAWMALATSEISEALEAYRTHALAKWYREDGKPEGVAAELADVIIRIFDTCGALNIDIEGAVLEKMRFNESRGYRHGNKNL